MHADVLDLVLVALVVGFAISGYRQGLIIGLLSFVGFLGGGVVGSFIAPGIARQVVHGQTQQALLAIVIVFLAATIGQFLASSLGAVMRRRVTWNAAATADAFGGALVSIVSVLLVAWLIGTAAAHAPFPKVAEQAQNSLVLGQVDRVMPATVRSWFTDFREFVDRSAFPQVFGNLGAEHVVQVPPPDKRVLTTAALRKASHSVVKVRGTAPSCQRQIEGSGFVFARDHVLTNAHVVSGVRIGPYVTVRGGHTYLARVVLYDPERDIAVLDVPGLRLRSLAFDHEAQTGDDAVVAGYPRDHGFTAVPARVRDRQRARGPDIYQDRQVVREIYSLRAVVQPGNSGGPLLAPNGSVYGVVFAAATDKGSDTGYALTVDEVRPDVERGAKLTRSVSTQRCD